MKKNLFWTALLWGISQSFGQGPYLIYYAVDHMKMEGYIHEPTTGGKSFELKYQKIATEAKQTFCYTWGCLRTQLFDHERNYIAVDHGYMHRYDMHSRSSNPTDIKVQGVYVNKSEVRELDLNIKSFLKGSEMCSESYPIVFDSDLPKYLDLRLESRCKKNVGVLDFKGEFRGTMAMVSEAKTLPYLTSALIDPMHISAASVTIKAPDFMTEYFKPEEISWSYDGVEQKFTGHSINVGTSGTMGSGVDFEQICGIHTYAAVVKKFNWTSGAIKINFSPNLQLGKDIIVQQPLCVLTQANGDNLKHDAALSLGSSSMNRIFNVAYLDSNNEIKDDKTLDSVSKSIPLSAEQKSYNLAIRERLGFNPAGGDIYSCDQFFTDIDIVPPAPIRIVEHRFVDARCFGEQPRLFLKVEGNSDWYTLSYGDSVHSLYHGNLQNVTLKKGSGTFDFKVYDALGCAYDSALCFEAIEPDELYGQLLIGEVPCHDSTAMVHIEANGGSPFGKLAPYRYVFENEKIVETSSMVVRAGTALSPRVYDRQGCLLVLKDTVLYNPTNFRLGVLQHTHNRCAKSNDATVILKGISTDTNYAYKYSQDGRNFVSTAVFDKLPSGIHHFYVQNPKGCLKDTSIEITYPPTIQMNALQTDVRCEGEHNGSIKLDITGGTGLKSLSLKHDSVHHSQSYGFSKEFRGLSEGTYWFYVQDSLGCKDSVKYAIGTQSRIRHHATLLNPICAESNDGEITLEVLGGRAPYQSRWLSTHVPDGGLVQKGLQKGAYVLKTVDSLACVKIDTFILTAPKALFVRLEGNSVLCKGQNLELDAGPLGVSYEWSSAKGFKANTRKVLLTEADVYSVKVINDVGCMGMDTFALQHTEVELKAEFLVASTVVQGDTVVLVNNNAYIDSISWHLDAQNTQVLTSPSGARAIQVIFEEQGEQEVQMVAYHKGCSDVLRKKIWVIDAKDREKYDNALGIKSSIFKSYELFPNPNNGHFELHISLREPELPLTLILSSMSTGSVIKQFDPKTYPDGKVSFKEELPEGSYVLHAQAGEETVALRFLITID